jgi:hypothetical protein
MGTIPTLWYSNHKDICSVCESDSSNSHVEHSGLQTASDQLLEPEDNLVSGRGWDPSYSRWQTVLCLDPDEEMASMSICKCRDILQAFTFLGIAIPIKVTLVLYS